MRMVTVKNNKEKRVAKLPNNKKELDKYYAVRYNGEIKMYLSSHLAVKQGLTIAELKNLKNIHRKRLRLFDEIERTKNIIDLHALAKRMEEIEFQLQEGWHFPKDNKFHSWWFRMPKCKCPELDNKDNLGTNNCIITEDCPLHGKLSV
jgi:hypothetical protein